MRLTKKQLENLRKCHEIQGAKGNWDFDNYMCGMFNGMELMLAIVENREPDFRQAPKGRARTDKFK